VGHPETAPHFAARDRPRIPPHWLVYEGRRSVLASANANRKAERPLNALLNYAFALLEAEATLARKAEVRERNGRETAKQRPPEPERLALWACPECASPVTNPRHVLCPACQVKAGHTAEVRQTRGRAIAARKALLKASADSLGFPADKDWYRANILPRLASHKLSELMECGISKGYASYIRSGKYVPHVSTWPALARLAGVELPVSF
jgi:hypothetical protein